MSHSPVSTAEEVVSTEVHVCQNDQGGRGDKPVLTPEAREMAESLYENITMGADAYLTMLPRVEDSRLKTDITAALCYYEKLGGKVKAILESAGVKAKEKSMMAKMPARAGIAMNTAMDHTTSHIAEMLIEGCSMSVTTATKLENHAEGKEHCQELSALCRDWARFEENHMESLKQYL